MKKITRIIFSDIIEMISLRRIITSLFVFVFACLLTDNNCQNIPDVIEYTFYGPTSVLEILIKFFTWAFYQIPILFYVLDFINKQLQIRNTYTILRVGNKKVWINCIIISTIFINLVYYLFGFMIASIFNFKILINPINISGLCKLLNILLILSFSSFIICIIGIVFIIIIKHEAIVFSTIFMLICLSIDIGNKFPNLDKWLLFNQGLIAKHYKSGFNYTWSYCYLLIAFLVLYILIIKLINKIDLCTILKK